MADFFIQVFYVNAFISWQESLSVNIFCFDKYVCCTLATSVNVPSLLLNLKSLSIVSNYSCGSILDAFETPLYSGKCIIFCSFMAR